MKIHVLAARAAAVAFALAASVPALAAAQVDQAQYAFNTGIPWGFAAAGGQVQANTGVGQSYTAGISGRLAAINLYCNGVCSIDQGGNTLTLSLYKGNDLVKTVQTTTSTGTFDTVYKPGFRYIAFDFTGQHVNQFAGQSYRFVLDSVTGPGDMKVRGGLGQIGNPYAGGSGSAGVLYGNSFPGFDMTFNTTVEAGAVPEPASWAMLIAGFGLVGASQRRRRPVAA